MKIYFVCVGERPHAKYAVESFKKHGLITVQITSHPAWKIDGIDEFIVRFGTDNLMLYMMQSFAEIQAPFITTADDCILDKPLDYVLSQDYDVAIIKRGKTSEWSMRAYNHFPYNNGLVVVKHPDFYRDCFVELLSMKGQDFKGVDYWKWFGDMKCIANVLERGKYRVLELDEKTYSKKPMFKGDGNNGEAVMYHYAKETKPWMEFHGKGITK